MQRKRSIHKQGAIHAHPHTRHAIAQPTDLEYIRLFDTCEIQKERLPLVDKTVDGKMIPGKPRYQNISSLVVGGPAIRVPSLEPAGSGQANHFSLPAYTSGSNSRIPWYFIACVHYRECGFSFKRHLHNGDPLTGYTTHVPANRPQVGHPPPFTFEESAVDALKLLHFDKIAGWTLPVMLRKLEAYNGFGYSGLHKIPSPYLWGYSNHYTKGLYVSDGKFDAEAIGKQMGTAVLLKRMEQRGLISIPRT